MKTKTKGLLAGFLAGIMMLSILPIGTLTTLAANGQEQAGAESQTKDFEKIYDSVGDYIASLGVPNVGSVGGEWMVIGLARSGREVPKGYYDNVVQYVKEHINDKEQLHKRKSTDNSRVILGLTALGYDVTNVDGHNLLIGLNDMDYVKWQGINGPIWALIAFDSLNYEIPTGDVTREALVSAILEKQLANGGWAFSGSKPDPDMTAMAVQSLAPYYTKDTKVKTAVDQALNCLSEMQTSTGGYLSWGTVNSESCAQVIVALTALGIDPHTDTRFIKDGNSVLDALLAFQVDGGFRHTMSGTLNGMATEQGYYALVSYARLKENKTSLYDMSDLLKQPEEVQKPNENNQSVQTAKPVDNSSKVQSPKTGDVSNVWIYLGFMMVSLAGFVLTAKRDRREGR